MKIVVDVPDEEYESYALAITFGMGSTAIRRILEGKPYEERKAGKWIITKRNGILCGVCHSGFRRMPTLDGNPIFRYCPFCGAEMEGEEEDDS